MKRLHFSYLNEGFEAQVINSWKSQGCFESVARDMGYRFALESIAYTSAPRRGSKMELRVRLKNLGYASTFNARPVFIVLKNGMSRHVFDISASSGADPRRWFSGQSVDLQAQFDLPSAMIPGTYTLALWMPDEATGLRSNSAYSVQLANSAVWDAGSGENILTQVTVD